MQQATPAGLSLLWLPRILTRMVGAQAHHFDRDRDAAIDKRALDERRRDHDQVEIAIELLDELWRKLGLFRGKAHICVQSPDHVSGRRRPGVANVNVERLVRRWSAAQTLHH